MYKSFIYFFICFVLILILSEKTYSFQTNIINDTLYNTADSINLSPEELFSSSLIEDFLGEESDEDLQYFLENDIYPLVKNSGKLSFDCLSNSIYLLQYVLNNQEYCYIIQKYYDVKNEEIYYEKTQTSVNLIKYFINK